MKKKILAMLLSMAMIVTLIPVMSFATDEDISKVLNNLDDEDAVETIKEDGSELVEEIIDSDEIDSNLIENISGKADVSVEEVDENLMYMNIDIQEPVETEIYDNGIELQEYETCGIIFENETYLDSNEIEEEIENSIEENNDSEELISEIKDCLVPECYADSIDEQYNSYGAIKAIMRVVYKQHNGGTGNTTFVKYIKSSTKLKKLKDGAKLTKVKVTCKVNSAYARSKPEWKKKVKGKVINNSNSETYNSPSFGKWYKADSPTDLWCWCWGYVCNCHTVVKVNWKRNGKSYDHTFQMMHSDCKQ